MGGSRSDQDRIGRSKSVRVSSEDQFSLSAGEAIVVVVVVVIAK